MAATETLVFEIGTEEMPASAVEVGISQLKNNAEKALTEARLRYKNLDTMGTPRRLVLVVKDLASEQEKAYHEIRGPSEKTAFDESFQPTAAAIGFARAQKVKVTDLVIEDTPQGRYVFARRAVKPAKTVAVLPDILKNLTLSFDFPKSMRWNHGDIRFSRPIRWILALYGNKTVSPSLEDIPAGNITYGHPFLGNHAIRIEQADQFEKRLSQAGVVVDHRRRERLILKEVKEKALSTKGKAAVDPAVLKEVIHLVEHPQAVLGTYSKEFLKLPRSVLVTAMQSHQRYFPVEDKKGKLISSFIVVHNGNKKHDNVIRKGHERVLRARLSDAWFFFKEDLKVPLSERVTSLKDILFQERLGSLYDKTLRVRELARIIGKHLKVDAATITDAERAAYLSKADLTTNMVREFPNLQGVVGEEYALVGKERRGVARAIAEHYLPRYVGDVLPKTLAGSLISMADKIDTIVGCFGIGFIPTGSEDPYALRRQGQGVVAIILDKKLTLPFEKIIEAALKLYQIGGFKLKADRHILSELDIFFKQRLKFHFSSEGFRYDVADAVLALPLNNPLDLEVKARLINQSLGTSLMDDLLTAFERCYNLSRGVKMTRVNPRLFESKYEEDLYKAVLKVEKDLSLKSLAGMRPVVDKFFDEVLVMAEENRLRQNRLNLLLRCVNLFASFADFSKIVRESVNSSQ